MYCRFAHRGYKERCDSGHSASSSRDFRPYFSAGMAEQMLQFDLERLAFAGDVDWLPAAERARIQAPAASLRIAMWSAWFVATAISLVAVGFIPPSRRRRGKHGGLRRRMLRSAACRWLGRDALEPANIAELEEIADGHLVRIEGRVRVRGDRMVPGSRRAARIPDVAHPTRGPCSFEQLAITIELGSEEHARVYHLQRDRAVDFDLVDDHGRAARVQMAGARLIGPPIPEIGQPLDALRQLEPVDWPSPLDQLWPTFHRLTMGCFHLVDGDRIAIYGFKDRVIDRCMAGRLARQDPVCAALRSGDRAPLVILAR